MPKNTLMTHGRRLTIDDTDIHPVAVDVIAKLSGVNFASVKKILSAMSLLRQAGITVTEMAYVHDMPALHAYAGPQDEFVYRAEQADKAVEFIRARVNPNSVEEEILNLTERFRDCRDKV